MRATDSLKYSWQSITANRLRSLLTTLGIAIGIGSVILLTSIGEGVQRFVVAEFTQFGTNLIAIVPGRTTTMGMSGAVISNVRPLSLDDEQALSRLPGVTATVPVVQGNGEIESGRRQRRTTILGVGPRAPEVWQFAVATGTFLPPDDPRAARAFAVLGSKVRDELFGTANPLGAIVRIGGFRYRVTGVMEAKGQILGFDLDDAVYIPATRALELFNRTSLMEIDILYRAEVEATTIAERLKKMLIERHGSEDFTITTQDQMLDVLGDVLDKLTFAVAALGGISLLVGGVGIMTIMTIAVQERTGEIGLLRALGAPRGQVLRIFLLEAVLLSSVGGTAGLAGGVGGARLLHSILPALPTQTNLLAVVLSFVLSVGIGLLAGIIPAVQAAGLDPQEALRAD
ncbi:MAG: ABC transporter permease [Thermodesulfobacteriota bacterium]